MSRQFLKPIDHVGKRDQILQASAAASLRSQPLDERSSKQVTSAVLACLSGIL
jgi:hypothetical protein